VLTLGRRTERALAGVVRDGAARPVAGARVLAFPPGPAAPVVGREGATPLAVTRTDPGGHFRFERLPDGPLSLEVRHDSYPPQREAIDARAVTGAGAEITIQLPLPGAVRGEVHERVTGGPVPRFEVEAVGPNGGTAQYPGGGRHAEGRRPDPFHFRLGPLAPGDWTIRARAPGYAPVERQVQVPAAGTIGEPSVRDLRLELDRS
jgi:carboxypeptidase family protein